MKKIIKLKNNLFILMFFCFSFFIMKSCAAYVNTECYATTNGSKIYSVKYYLKVDNISSSTPNGSVVGKVLAKKTHFTCDDRGPYAWGLQILPSAMGVGGSSNICKTNIDGVGVQYIDVLGRPINCDSWNEILRLKSADVKSGDLEEGTVLANIIKTGPHSGNNSGNLILNSILNAYYDGGTNASPWGNLILQGSSEITFYQYQPQIYFPSSPQSMPIIDLNINSFINRRGTSGKAPEITLDMCLYDGNESTSKGLKLTFSDQASGIAGRSPGLFSIFRNGGNNNNVQDRLDYKVSILNPTNSSKEEIKNGVEIYWSGVNERKILRQVVLPGISGVSLCVPAPITFSTPIMDISGKSSGKYSGVLTIIYTPST